MWIYDATLKLVNTQTGNVIYGCKNNADLFGIFLLIPREDHVHQQPLIVTQDRARLQQMLMQIAQRSQVAMPEDMDGFFAHGFPAQSPRGELGILWEGIAN